MGGNPFGLILSIGSVRIVVSFTCCDLRRAFLFPENVVLNGKISYKIGKFFPRMLLILRF